MKRISVALVLLVAASALLFANGQSEKAKPAAASSTSTQSGAIKTGGTLRIVMPWGPLPDSLNPLTPGGQHIGVTNYIYESLFYVNDLNGKVKNLLGSSYTWKNNNLKLDVTVRQGVKWSDGTPLTAKDVAFSFNLVKKYPALDNYGLWSKVSGLQSVVAQGNHVVFSFSKANTPMFFYIAQTLIVPEHIWAGISDPGKYTNMHPVGTGPFEFVSYTPDTSTVVLKKNPNYWMAGRPYINEIKVTSVKSNNTALLNMLKYDADWSYLFVPDVTKSWVGKNPQVNKMWWPVTNTNILYLNTQKAPFNNVTVRKAIALAIDKKALVQKAYYGIGSPGNPTGIVPAQQSQWLDQSLASKISSFDYNVAKAKQLLQQAGYTKDSNGDLVDPSGNKVPSFKILVGAGWTDFITQAQIISQNLKELGISTTTDQEPWNSYITSVMSGTYDMVICWGTGTGPDPYNFYYQEFNPAFSASKIGEKAQSDYARFTNPTITKNLSVFSSTSDHQTQIKAMHQIESVVLDNVPFIPLTSRTNFGIYSEHSLVGWPTAANPYDDGGAPDTWNAEIVALNLHLK